MLSVAGQLIPRDVSIGRYFRANVAITCVQCGRATVVRAQLLTFCWFLVAILLLLGFSLMLRALRASFKNVTGDFAL